MPIKRRKAKARNVQITAEMVELFRKCLEIELFGDDEFWAEEGGRRREYLDAMTELHLLLHLHPWECSPLDAHRRDPPDYGSNQTFWHQSYERAHELRKELERAAKDEGK